MQTAMPRGKALGREHRRQLLRVGLRGGKKPAAISLPTTTSQLTRQLRTKTPRRCRMAKQASMSQEGMCEKRARASSTCTSSMGRPSTQPSTSPTCCRCGSLLVVLAGAAAGSGAAASPGPRALVGCGWQGESRQGEAVGVTQQADVCRARGRWQVGSLLGSNR